MKVAHILNVPLESHGGIALLAREIAFGLAKHHETIAICPKCRESKASHFKQAENIKIEEWENALDHRKVESFVNQCLDRHGIEIAIFHGGDFSWGLLSKRISSINRISKKGRVILTVNHQSNPLFSRMPLQEHKGFSERFSSFASFAIAWFYKHLQLKHTDLEINVSDHEYKSSLRRYPLFRHKFKRIYHSRMPPMAGNEDYGSLKQKHILSVGHFAYRKGQHVLLKAFSRICGRHTEWRLQLVGGTNTGSYHARLEAMLNDLKIRDKVDLVTETFDPDDYFRQASIYVQPSIIEAYGLALQEAMYFGCACVGADVGGITDSITDDDYIFPAGDDLRLAGILDRLMSNGDLLQTRMQADHERARIHQRDRATMLSEYAGVFASMDQRIRNRFHE